MSKRFKIASGKMLVIPPGEPAEWHMVNLIYDLVNHMVGIQVTGDSQLKGHVVFISRAAFDKTIASGIEFDEVRSV